MTSAHLFSGDYMYSNPPKVVILDAGRAFGSPQERAFSDHVARDFHRVGWAVDWHIDVNDALAPRPYARLCRTLRPTPMAAGLEPFNQPEPPLADDAGETGREEPHTGEEADNRGLSGGFAPMLKRKVFRVAAYDQWARSKWHDEEAGWPIRLLALIVWGEIRAYYGVRRNVATASWRLVESARTAGRAIYWKGIYPCLVEPTRRLARSLYWKMWFPAAEFVGRAARAAYWRGVFPCAVEPATRLARVLYWNGLFPAAEFVLGSVRAVYWRGIFPYVVEPAGRMWRWLSWRLFEPATGGLRRQAQSLRRMLGAISPRFGKSRVAKEEGAHGGLPVQSLPAVPHIDDRHQLFHGFARWLKRELARHGAPVLVVVPCAEISHFEALLAMVPALGIDRPLDIPIVACLSGRARVLMSPGLADAGTLCQRLASGSPFGRVYVADASGAIGEDGWHGLAVTRLDVPATSDAPQEPPAGAAAGAFVRLAIACAEGQEESSAPALSLTAFGPLAIVSSALWGRVGSSTIFDSQVRVLLANGYRVARFYFDHWPHYGEDRLPRIARMVSEDQQSVRPHYQVVFERNEAGRRVGRLHASPEFLKASPVKRTCMTLADPVTTNAPAAAFLGERADIAVVNHLPHLDATRQLTKAPVVLETHDVFSALLDVHGIPGFVPKGPDGRKLRLAEERQAWASVDFCVNLSLDDQRAIAPHARQAAYVRPARDSTEPSQRSWPEVAVANDIPEKMLSPGFFDIMLWGSWHENNVHSIEWFIENVRPLLGRYADARIVVAGKVVKGLGRFVEAYPEVLFCKFVDRLEDIASRAQVLVIPDQGGTGICVKAMDALAWGRPFAATVHGMRGTDLSGVDYAPATNAQALADDIVKLLASEAERRKRLNVGRQLFEANYSGSAYQEAFASILASVNPKAARRAAMTAVASSPTPVAAVPAIGASNDWSGDPALSVVVATYDRYDVLPDAIASLRRQNVPRGFLEIIVVDNSPDQAWAARVAERYAGVEEVRYLLEPTPGLSNARNVGTEAARGGIVAFIDDDAIADPEWARATVEAFALFGERAGIVGGRILPRWVKPQPAWLPDRLTSHLSIVDWGGELRELEPDKWVAGCNIAFRKSALRAVGGFSRALGRIGSGLALLSNDETEVARKIQALGYVTVYAPASRVDHVIDPARLKRQWFRRRAAWQAVSDFISDSQAAAARLPGAIKHVRWAMANRVSNVPFGFYGMTQERERFQQDAGLAYDFVGVVLSGGVDVAAAPDADAGGQQALPAASSPATQAATESIPRARPSRSKAALDGAGPAISVVIATYARYDVLHQAVRSLLDQDLAGSEAGQGLEIIVVDNSPDQQAAGQHAQRYRGEGRVRYVLEARPGLSNARNVGLAHAGARIVAFMDDDAIAAPDWARQLLAVFDGPGGKVAVVGGRILPQWVQPKPDWLPDSLLGYLSIVDWPSSGPRPLKSDEWIAGCNMAFDRQALLQAGGFLAALGRIGSQASLLSNDDTEVIERVKALGKTVLYHPGAVVHHVIDPNRLTRQWFRRRSAWQAVSDFIKDPKEASRYAEVAGKRVFDSVSLPSVIPGVESFVRANDPVEFGRRVGIFYDLTIMSLAGGAEVDPAGRLVASGGIRNSLERAVKAKARAVVHPGSPLRRLARSVRRT